MTLARRPVPEGPPVEPVPGRGGRRFGPVAYAGPAALVAVGYIDPGNWGTDITAGAMFGHRLLWVLVVANVVALFLQYLAARLGLVTGADLAELLGRRLSGVPRALVVAVVAVVLVATEVAEFLGVVLALRLLLGIPMALAIALGAVLVIGTLTVAAGNRAVQRCIIWLLAVVAGVYVFELWLSRPGGQVASGLVPTLPPDAAPVAIAMLGATVMPHNLFLHSRVVRWPLEQDPGGAAAKSVLRRTVIASAVALNVALLINAAILVVAADTHEQRQGGGPVPATLAEAAESLTPALGPLATGAFGLGLLAAGLASTTTSGVTGQFVIEGLTGLRPPLLARRAAALVPAALLLFLGVGEVRALMLSQLVLSLALPVVIYVLIRLTTDRTLMGPHTGRPVTRYAAYGVLALVVVADLVALADLVRSPI
ncbi:Nramp family divalent metal transporter [Actinomadura meridiana]|uniref:Nramp family divalent metal transporter n=1 Tax=Actinomadura meridiana TaxID=559626 RepID=A0ABP8C2H7_9ACTN